MSLSTSDQPIKVLLVASFPVQYATPQYVRYAADPRLDVTVAYCSLRGAEPVKDSDLGVVVEWDVPLLDGYRWVHPPDRSGRLARRLVGFLNPRLWHVVREGSFDVVVCYGYRSASHWIAAIAARMSGTNLVWTSDATRLRPRPDASGMWWKPAVKGALLPLVFGSGQGVLTPSTKGRRFLSSIGIDADRVFMTPNVVDNDFFAARSKEADREAVRREWGVPPDAFVALFCGKLVPWKRPMDLLEATALVSDAFAVFAGDGVLRRRLEARVRALGLEERVRFLGFVNQSRLPATYGGADVLVLPSEYEPFGLVVNEAFASGTPAVVTTACGSAGDLVRDNCTGLIYASGDVPALAEHLRRLVAEPALRDRLARGAGDRISRWGIKENVNAFADAMIQITRKGAIG